MESGPFPTKIAPKKQQGPSQVDVLKAMHEAGRIQNETADYPRPQIIEEEIQIGPEKKPFELPPWVTPEMKARIDNKSYNETDEFDPKILQQAIKEGLFHNIDSYVAPPGITDRFTIDQEKQIDQLMKDIDQNAELLRVIGVPRDQLMPLNRQHNDQKAIMNRMKVNSNFFNPVNPSYQEISDRSLGLDPSKFTKKKWNPGDYNSGLKSVVDNLRQSQEVLLGPEPKELTREEQDTFNRAKLKQIMGY